MFKRGVELGKSPRRAIRCTLRDVHKTKHEVDLHNPSAEENVLKTVLRLFLSEEWHLACGIKRERYVYSFSRLVST